MYKKVIKTLIFLTALLIFSGYATESDIDGDKKPFQAESSEALRDARALYDLGKKQAAIYLLQQEIENNSGNFQVLLELGKYAIAEKNWAYAIEIFKKVTEHRPEDIQVRLILMRVYKAYQQTIQEIKTAKEIIALDPGNIYAANRLVELYQEQAMVIDEKAMRYHLREIQPENYKNHRRLVELLILDSEFWEAALVLEDIRRLFPNKHADLYLLAKIYYDLDEHFRGIRILDDMKKIGLEDEYIYTKMDKKIRIRNNIFDLSEFYSEYLSSEDVDLDVDRFNMRASYIHSYTRKKIDLGILFLYSNINYSGVNVLTGSTSINSGELSLVGRQNWQGKNFSLTGKLGIFHDQVSGQLSANDTSLTFFDFPFLLDPSFDSYGGTIPVGSIRFDTRPWQKEITYGAGYEHRIVDELDARLSQVTQHIVSTDVGYTSTNKTLLKAQLNNIIYSDGNHRLQVRLTGNYTVWADTAQYDHNGKRTGFIRADSFFKLGYEFLLNKDEDMAELNRYETFTSSESRHFGSVEAQKLLYRDDQQNLYLFNLKFRYGQGTTLENNTHILASLIYRLSNDTDLIHLNYFYVDELSSNFADQNLQIGGSYRSHGVGLKIKWRF